MTNVCKSTSAHVLKHILQSATFRFSHQRQAVDVNFNRSRVLYVVTSARVPNSVNADALIMPDPGDGASVSIGEGLGKASGS